MSAKDWSKIFEWRVDDDGVTITEFLQEGATSVDVPNEIDGKPVVAIGDSAFSGCKSLMEVSLPAGLQTIGASAFDNCSSLMEVSLPAGLQTIGDEAFWGCSSLTEVSLPAGLQTLGDSAFYGCKSLLNLGVVKGNANFRSFDGVLFSADGKTLVIYPAARQDSEYVVPDGVVEIADRAFYGCKSLMEVSLPAGLQTIGYGGFRDCSSLMEVTFPKGLQTIGGEAFRDCSSLTEVSLPAGLQTIGDEAFLFCKLGNVAFPKGVKIGKNVLRRDELPPSSDPFYWAERGGVYADWGNPF